MNSHRTAIVMSRLPRLIDPQGGWLCGLRAALRHIKKTGETLAIVDGTAGSAFVRRGAERLQIPVDAMTVDDPQSKDSTDPTPERDRWLASAAGTVLALGIRTHGNVHAVLRDRLKNGQPVVLIDRPDLQSKSVRDELVSLGATLWSPDLSEQVPFDAGPRPVDDWRLRSSIYEVVPFPSSADWAFISHTTRACGGPWPGQSQDDYVDSLLNAIDADHSAESALVRILRQRKLLASSRTIRGGHPVVCLTAVPLLELPKLHQFRTHRARWDFEPYGLCIQKKWLRDRGARPVLYGDDGVWSWLSPENQPFFQVIHRPESGSADFVDWSVELEWRHAGDLDLSDLPSDQGLVFVPRFESVMRLSGISPWPITLWPDPAAAIPNE